MEGYKNKITETINNTYKNSNIIFTVPPDINKGHISMPCFAFAKQTGKNPKDTAEEIGSLISGLDFIDKIEVINGFLNIFIKKERLFKDIINEVYEKGQSFGSSLSGRGKFALVEHTSINPNASPHVGRARNAMIGDFLVRLLRFEGYNVEVHYFVNDIGKQIAMLMLGAMDKKEVTFNDLLNIYVDINKKVEENPELEKEVFDLLYKLEQGDEEIRGKFRNLVDICIKGQTEIFSKLGIKYDVFDYESDYIYKKITNDVLKDLGDTGKLEEDKEGRLALNQEEYSLPVKAPYMVLTRKDKTSLYPLRDIAYTIDKVKTGKSPNIVVLGEDQKLYFRQVCAALDVLGYDTPSAVHYSFVLLKEGKMATRKGNVVLLEDFMEEAYQKAYDEIVKRHGAADEKTARIIGYGAVKYAIMRASNDKNVVFDWDTAMSFEGESGPYLLYGLARINSLFRNFDNKLDIKNIDFSCIGDEYETGLICAIAQFQQLIKSAVSELSPHTVANYAYDLAKKFSTFYQFDSVLSAETENIKLARLALGGAVRQVLLNCFGILGIEPVDAM